MTTTTETLEIYQDGELVETRTVVVPPIPELPAVAALRSRLAEVEEAIDERVSARIAALESRTNGLDMAALKADIASIKERINRAAGQAAQINPNAVQEPGARSEFAKVKEALTPDPIEAPAEEGGA